MREGGREGGREGRESGRVGGWVGGREGVIDGGKEGKTQEKINWEGGSNGRRTGVTATVLVEEEVVVATRCRLLRLLFFLEESDEESLKLNEEIEEVPGDSHSTVPAPCLLFKGQCSVVSGRGGGRESGRRRGTFSLCGFNVQRSAPSSAFSRHQRLRSAE
jgi:hypothetical protein